MIVVFIALYNVLHIQCRPCTRECSSLSLSIQFVHSFSYVSPLPRRAVKAQYKIAWILWNFTRLSRTKTEQRIRVKTATILIYAARNCKKRCAGTFRTEPIDLDTYCPARSMLFCPLQKQIQVRYSSKSQGVQNSRSNKKLLKCLNASGNDEAIDIFLFGKWNKLCVVLCASKISNTCQSIDRQNWEWYVDGHIECGWAKVLLWKFIILILTILSNWTSAALSWRITTKILQFL